MSMSTFIRGVRDLDGKFASMLAVKLACEEAGVEYPQEVQNYFCGQTLEPEDYFLEPENYLRREMEFVDISAAVRKDAGKAVEGWIVDLSKLPEEVKAIRFENCW